MISVVQAEPAQPLRFFTQALLYQQPGQPLGGVRVVGVGPRAQPVQVTPLLEQIGQPPGGIPVAGVGAGPPGNGLWVCTSASRGSTCIATPVARGE